jgi:hypothetical protein
MQQKVSEEITLEDMVVGSTTKKENDTEPTKTKSVGTSHHHTTYDRDELTRSGFVDSDLGYK